MRKVAILLIVFLGIACNRHVVPPLVVTQKDSTEHKSGVTSTEKETPLKPDSALVHLQIKCDSLGRAYIAFINQLQGERVNQSINQSSQDKGLNIDIQAKDKAKERQKETVSWDTLYIYKEKPVPYPVDRPVNYVSGWQWFQIWVGRILLVLIIAANAFKLIRSKVGTLNDLLNKAKTIFN